MITTIPMNITEQASTVVGPLKERKVNKGNTNEGESYQM